MNLEVVITIPFRKVKTPKSPEGNFEEFIDFQRIPFLGTGVR
jgi:hypothetical protein